MIIYKITNLVNNKVYIGQTIQDLKLRWGAHKRAMKAKKDHPLYNSMNKYGVDNFKIEEIATASSIKELNRKEVCWANVYKAHDREFGYNLRECGGNRGKHSKETKKKISNALKGRICSKEPKEKMILTSLKNSYNIGEKNGNFGRGYYNIWIEKYGIEEDNRRQASMIEKHKETIKRNKKN